MKFSRSVLVKVAGAALALAAAGTASVAQARSDVYFSIGANVAPGVHLGVSNAPVYYPSPVYVQPAPVYYAPAPVYYAPSPVYVRPAPVYYGAAPVYYSGSYGRPHFKQHKHGKHNGHRHGGNWR